MNKPIPPSIAEAFEPLDMELTGLYIRRNFYRQLFEKGPLRLELFDQIASNLFVFLRAILFDDIVLGVCRLTDPAESQGKPKMTFEQLVRRVESAGQIDLAGKLKTRLGAVEVNASSFRPHRNKRIAHRDLNRQLSPNRYPLPGVDIDVVERTLGSMAHFLNEVNLHYTNGTTIYDLVVTQHDGNSLVQWLREAVVFRDMMMKEDWDLQKRLENDKYHDA